jgi:hypothetical protein
MEFSNLGKHCEHPRCHQLDFLPFKCDGCTKTYCLDHRTYDAHTCPKTLVVDKKVPTCPLCDAIISIPKGGDINAAVDQHITSGCKPPEKEKIYKNKCTVKGCKQCELIPINCKQCRQIFCLKHRSPLDHKCSVKLAPEPSKLIGPFRVPIKIKS